MNKKILRWELIGILLIFGFGTTLHFWFEWTDYWRPVALIAAVNESTWEHFKMGFWPGLFYALIEYRYIKTEAKNFLVAKFYGLLAMPVITSILFYSYTSLTGQHFLVVDIIIFFLSVAGGQLVSLNVLTRSGDMKPTTRQAAMGGLLVMILAFSLLSYFPPKNFLFAHPETGEYGILSDYDEHDH